jgi:hypothetical protein
MSPVLEVVIMAMVTMEMCHPEDDERVERTKNAERSMAWIIAKIGAHNASGRRRVAALVTENY